MCCAFFSQVAWLEEIAWGEKDGTRKRCRRTWLGSCSSKAKVEGTCDHLSQLGRRRPSSICLFGCLGLSQRQWRGKGQWQGRLGWLGYQYTWHWHDRLDLAGLAIGTQDLLKEMCWPLFFSCLAKSIPYDSLCKSWTAQQQTTMRSAVWFQLAPGSSHVPICIQ